MRTTLALDDDVLSKAREIAGRRQVPFRQVVNEALHAGLDLVKESPEARPYHTRSHRMGLKQGLHLDNVQELLAIVDGEASR